MIEPAKMEEGVEEIRRAVGILLRLATGGDDEQVKAIKRTLSNLGIVIKKKCPDCEWSQFTDEAVVMTPCHHCNCSGYIYEPLIEEAEKHGVRTRIPKK